ncbi:MAG: RHS repeat domain-containing protein [Candidatus Woesearchaeota archaeon]
MNFKTLAIILVFFALIANVLAADQYKPYLHKPIVPSHPEIKLYGEYSTNLYSGIASYSYLIDTPKGVNGLEPTIGIYYNSETVKSRPSILGAGWSMNYNYIYRDVNFTPDNTNDELYVMYLDGNIYELVYSDGLYHSKVDYYYRIQNLNNYWIVTLQDGRQHRFGFNPDSRLDSNRGYTLKWTLDLVTDTHGNTIQYSYIKDPYPEDFGSQYLSNITYNSEALRRVEFTYENNTRPDRRRIYMQGNMLEESRRLSDIIVKVDDQIVKKDHFDYIMINPSMSSVSNIVHYGSNNSVLYNISFDYYLSAPGFNRTSSFSSPMLFSNSFSMDFGVRLVDINNDGFTDLIQSYGSSNSTWINNKSIWINSSWNVPVQITDISGYDQGTRLEDVNDDGLTDILKSKDSSRIVFLNNGSGWTNFSWTIPIDFVTGTTDQGVQVVDVNGDSKPDLIKGKDGVKSVYLNTGSGWVLDNSWILPIEFINSSTDTGARLADLNGDGLIDIVRAATTGSIKNSWLNTGSGWISTIDFMSPAYFITTVGADNNVRLIDVNNDGLVDVLDGNSSTYLNNGTSWVQDISWVSPESFMSGTVNIGRRLADVDGDGFTDIIVSYNDASQNYVWIKNHTLPYLLKSIKNEYGGSVLLNYTTSTQFNNTLNNTSQIGFNIYVVNSVIKSNSIQGTLNAVASTSNNYSLGAYSYANKEFRGFGKATEMNNNSVVEHYFYQDDARKGKEYSTRIYDNSGAIYSRKDIGYNYTVSDGIYNLSILHITDYLYDAQSTPMINNKSFFYNTFGNYQYIIDWGDVNIFGDEKYYNYSYAINTNQWILNKVARETVYDSTLTKVRESKNYYDSIGLTGMGLRSDLTKTELWNSNGNNSFAYYDYDRYGNVISRTDNYANTEKYTYDITNTYPSTYINALGHITYYNYNISTGNLLYVEKNSIRTSYEYDAFGRITKEIQPYDSIDLPTKKYIYEFDGIVPEKTTVKQRTTADKYKQSVYFYDGFANLIQAKEKFNDTTEIDYNIFYDNKFRAYKIQNPYFNNLTDSISNISNSSNYTQYIYDALDRVIQVTNPDGTIKKTIFDQRNISDFDENNHEHMYVLDGLGRIINVFEYNTNSLVNATETYITSYSYDGNDNLVRITDNEGHEFQFMYDSLSRKIGMIDPDMGNWTYSYDLNSNLIKQVDSRGQNITLTYDQLNRVISKNSNDVNVSFLYDQDYYGTLSKIYNNVNITYTYDKRMRKTKESLSTNGKSFDATYIYDSADRLIYMNDLLGINYYYDYKDNLYNISNVATITYNPLSQISSKKYGNGLTTTYTYDIQNYRLNTIISSGVQNMTYTYDSVGNIKSINDTINAKWYTMTYDDLDRMVRVAIGSDIYAYSYNSLGNVMKIVKNNQSKKYVYNNLAHAPSSIIDGSSGADVYAPKDVDSGSRNRTFEFFVINDNNITLNGVNVSVDFGNGQKFNATNLSIDTTIMFFIQANYSKGGDYIVKFNVTSKGITDYEWRNVKFGVRSDNLSILYSNTSYRTFEFDISSDIVETVYNASWNCSDGISSIRFDLASKQRIMDFIQHNYTSPGAKNFTCIALSTDGNESKTILFNVDGVKIEEFDVLYTNVSRRIITYDLHNYFNPLFNVNVTMTGDDTTSKLLNMSDNDKIMVFAEFNYTTDAYQDLLVTINANQSTDLYRDSFGLRGATIKNYNRVSKNYTTQVLMFDVWNFWNPGYVNWSIGEPNIKNSTYLANNESILVFIEYNYTTQGNRQPEINVTTSKYIDRIREFFEIRPIKISGLLTLSENKSNSVSELMIKNNLNNTQSLTWKFDTGILNVTNFTSLNASESILIFIASNYTSSNIYQTNAFINNSIYNDTECGVVVT